MDDRLPLEPGEPPSCAACGSAPMGCYPLTGAIESAAITPAQILAELRPARHSEREERLIDGDEDAAMERKQREGHF